MKYHNENILHINEITILVKDIEVMLNYYTKVLGFELIKESNNIYELGVNNKTLVKFIHNPDASLKGRITGLYHFALLLPDEKYLGQIIKHYLETNEKIVGGSDHGVSQALYLKDPENNGIEIYVDRPDTLWEYDNNGVIMISEQLDYGTLIRNAFDEPFITLPKDTIIGHVHFHVNDLLKAESFFIDTLGFTQSSYFVETASFLSDQKYHHHVAVNTWNGVGINNRSENMTGLVSYQINIPKLKLKSFTNHLIDNKYEILNDDNGNYIYDINNVKVYF